MARLRHAGDVPGPRASRTIAAILQATRQIFLVSGYDGTTIDDITRMAGVSRSSFYTYFPSKRDALLALGAESLAMALRLIDELGAVAADDGAEATQRWVEGYFDHLDQHGSFSFAWTQAARQDAEIRRAGQRGHLEMCRRLGVALAARQGVEAEAPVESGLLAVAMLERVWSYAQLYGADVDRAAVERIAGRLLLATEPVAPGGRVTSAAVAARRAVNGRSVR